MRVDLNLIIDALREQDKAMHAVIKKSGFCNAVKEKYGVEHRVQNAIANVLLLAHPLTFNVKNFLLAIRENRLTNGKRSDRPVCRGCDGSRVNTFWHRNQMRSIVCSECDGTGMAPADWKERADYE